MIRKRDFLIFIVVLAFLVGAIILTLWSGVGKAASIKMADMILSNGDINLTAEVSQPDDDKQARLDALRAKIAQRPEIIEAPEETIAEAEPASAVEVVATTTTVDSTNIKNCPSYQTVYPDFLTGGLRLEQVGAQRSFFAVNAEINSTSTAEIKPVFSLPLRTSTAGFTSCVPTSVVAVTATGLPIQNSDFSKYKGRGEGSLIGYTVDGFELYGLSSTIDTDECGGASIDGVYRYYLSSERKAVLNCFVSIPVSL